MPIRTKSQYLLLLRHSGQPPSPAELEKLMAKFATWLKQMKARRQFVATHGLEFTGKVLRAPDAAVSDGPFIEAKEVVGGYLLIRARDLDHAAEIAKGCPALYQSGTTVEVRPVADHR